MRDEINVAFAKQNVSLFLFAAKSTKVRVGFYIMSMNLNPEKGVSYAYHSLTNQEKWKGPYQAQFVLRTFRKSLTQKLINISIKYSLIFTSFFILKSVTDNALKIANVLFK